MPEESLSILIVEDDAAARQSLVNLASLRYPDVAIHCADNGLSGLESFARHSPHIVVTDITMPVMDGISMAGQIKSLHPEVAVIALTAYSDTSFLMKSIEIGIDHYLLKPVDSDKLFAIIDKMIAGITEVWRRKHIENALRVSESELKAANELLELRVNERTADLQAAIQEQESFSYSVSHDLRAPLRHINSFSAILMEEFGEALPKQARGYLERIRGASCRMGALIDHLLELSRVGRTEIHLGPVNLSGLAATILAGLQETDPWRSVETGIEENIIVLGDESLLRQLLENLLGNAWKYTSKRSVARIEFGSTKIAGEPVLLVRDNGAGFEMKYQENLFVAFQRLHSGEFEGDGIGLTTAQRIIHRHGGDIWGEGEVDKGATFYFTLPIYY